MAFTTDKWIRLRNNSALKAINAAGSGTVDILKVDASDILQLLGTVHYAGYEIANKNYVDTGLSGKEPTIAAGTTSQYYRGDKSWQTLDTAAVSENASNKYFTDSRAKTAAVVNTLAGSETDQAPSVSSVNTALASKISSSEKGANSGVATLDAGGKIPTSQLPNSVMEFKGAWDASSNTPTLADGTGDAGDVYRVSAAGSQDLGSGSQSFGIGDWVMYNGSIWQHSPATDAVTSVNTQTGAVVLNTSHISENTNLYFTSARAKSAAVVNTLAGSETDQAPSVSSVNTALAGKEAAGTAASTMSTHESTFVHADIAHTNRVALDAVSGTNTGDETTSTIKTKLGAASASADGYLTSADWSTFNGKQAALGFTPENVANKSTDGTMADNSTTKYPSQSAVVSYVASQIGSASHSSAKEILTLASQDITNGYVDLAHIIVANSQIVVPVGGPEQVPGSDYTLSTVSSKTRITFAGDMAALLASGDKLIVSYTY